MEELFYKTSEKKFVDLFWQEGEMLRPLRYFRTVEGIDRKDEMEGQRELTVRAQEKSRLATDE